MIPTPPPPPPPKKKEKKEKRKPTQLHGSITKQRNKAKHIKWHHTQIAALLIFWLNIICAFSVKNKQKHMESKDIILTWMQN